MIFFSNIHINFLKRKNNEKVNYKKVFQARTAMRRVGWSVGGVIR